jgi:hypothetical protein
VIDALGDDNLTAPAAVGFFFFFLHGATFVVMGEDLEPPSTSSSLFLVFLEVPPFLYDTEVGDEEDLFVD